MKKGEWSLEDATISIDLSTGIISLHELLTAAQFLVQVGNGHLLIVANLRLSAWTARRWTRLMVFLCTFSCLPWLWGHHCGMMLSRPLAHQLSCIEWIDAVQPVVHLTGRRRAEEVSRMFGHHTEGILHAEHRPLLFAALDASIRQVYHRSLNRVLFIFVDKQIRSSNDNPRLWPLGRLRTAVLTRHQTVQVALLADDRTETNFLNLRNEECIVGCWRWASYDGIAVWRQVKGGFFPLEPPVNAVDESSRSSQLKLTKLKEIIRNKNFSHLFRTRQVRRGSSWGGR